MGKNIEKIAIGNEVAFNNLADATWFRVEAINGFSLTVREVGTDYATQSIDRSAVARVRPASGKLVKRVSTCDVFGNPKGWMK
jgi:hypothetical protein